MIFPTEETMNFMLDTLPGLIVERAIPSDVWGRLVGI